MDDSEVTPPPDASVEPEQIPTRLALMVYELNLTIRAAVLLGVSVRARIVESDSGPRVELVALHAGEDG